MLRRLRFNLRTFASALDLAWAIELRARIRWLGDGLAAVREADVLVEQIDAVGAQISGADRSQIEAALHPLFERRAAARNALYRLLRDPRYISLIDVLIAAAKKPRITGYAHRRARKAVAMFMKPAWRGLRKQVRRAGKTPSDRDLHRIRIKAKHLRFAAEVMVPIVGRRAQRFARRVEILQSELGEQHDAVNVCRALREHLETPERAFIAGELTALEEAIAARLRRRWSGNWQDVARKKLRFW